MPAVLRRINRIFRRNSRENQNGNNSNDSNNSNPSGSNNIRIHRRNNNNSNIDSDTEILNDMNVIKLRSTGYERQNDGSVTLSVRLDKDQVECCVCLSSMTDKIYRCRGNRTNKSEDNNNNQINKKKIVCHNICASCHWNMSRMKASNGHTKHMQCPICKVKGSFIRNFGLERQLTELSTECQHYKYGCHTKFFPWDNEQKNLHEKHLCIYQPIDCPFCYQTINGGRINFIEHLVKSVKIKNKKNKSENDSEIELDENDNISQSEEIIDENDDNEIELDDDENEMQISQSMIDDEMMLNNDEDEEEIIHLSESEQIEEEQKEAPINNDDDINRDEDSEMLIDSQMEFVPGCSMIFHESKSIIDVTQNERNIITRNRNEFIVNYNLGIVLCFIKPTKECPCWKIYSISISPRHRLGGNSRVYIQYCDHDEMTKFIEKEHSLGLITTTCLNRPITNTLITSLNRLHPTSLRKLFNSYPINNPFIPTQQQPQTQKSITKNINPNLNEMKDDNEMELDNTNNINSNNNNNNNNMTEEELEDLEEYKPKQFLGESPCTKIDAGFIFSGHKESIINNLYIRIFTLEESFKVGAVIDARDFTGKWYEAEIIAVQDFNGNIYDNLDNDNNDYLDIRKAKIHYLGYSQNYDEWLLIDTDSHRIAHRGTFTIGPDLRAIRRNTTNLHQQQNNNNNNNRSSNNNRNNNNNNNNNNRSSENGNLNINLIDIIEEDN